MTACLLVATIARGRTASDLFRCGGKCSNCPTLTCEYWLNCEYGVCALRLIWLQVRKKRVRGASPDDDRRAYNDVKSNKDSEDDNHHKSNHNRAGDHHHRGHNSHKCHHHHEGNHHQQHPGLVGGLVDYGHAGRDRNDEAGDQIGCRIRGCCADAVCAVCRGNGRIGMDGVCMARATVAPTVTAKAATKSKLLAQCTDSCRSNRDCW